MYGIYCVFCALLLASFTYAAPLQSISQHTDLNKSSNTTANNISSIEANPAESSQNNLTQIMSLDAFSLSDNTAPHISKPKDAQDAYNLSTHLFFRYYLDNLEGSTPFYPTRTFYALQIAPTLSIEHSDMRHALHVGGIFTNHLGHTLPSRLNLIAYYAYTHPSFSALLGIFPRHTASYPRLFFRPDYMLFHPLTQGLSLQARHSFLALKYQGEIMLDWYGGDATKRYDEFFILAMNEITLARMLYLRTEGLLYHIKNRELLNQESMHMADATTSLFDYALYNATLGVNLLPIALHLTKANISVSLLGSIERKRTDSTLKQPQIGGGSEVALQLEYKGMGLEERYYTGSPQMRYFKEFGMQVYNGDPFYQASSFHRVSAYYAYENAILRLNIELALYYLNPIKTIAFSQMLTLNMQPKRAITKAR